MAKVFSSSVSATVVTPNQSIFRAEVINVPLAGTPVQLPDIPVPDGVDLVIRAKQSNLFRKIYLSDSALNVVDATKRIELRAGEAIGLSITNANLVWIDASGNNTSIEVLVEA